MKPTAITLCTAALCAAALVGASVAGIEMENSRRVTLGERNLAIPERYLSLEGQMPWWLRWMPGLDRSQGELLLLIDAADVAKSIPAYQTHDEAYRDNLQVLLSVLSPSDHDRYVSSVRARLMEVWMGTGSYTDRIIARDSETGLFRVYRRVEYPYSWQLFTTFPDPASTPSDVARFWIGTCLEGSTPLKASGKLASCGSSALVDGVVVDFHTTGQNAFLLPKIRQYLTDLLSKWHRDAKP